MEIEKAPIKEGTYNVQADLGSNIAQAGQQASMKDQETRSWNAITANSVEQLASDLKVMGEQNALIDASKDDAAKQAYEESKLQEDTTREKISNMTASIEVKRLGQIDTAADEAELAKLQEQHTTHTATLNANKEALKTSSLQQNGSTLTVYGEAYKAKAQAIATNRLLIDLDRANAEAFNEYSTDPLGYFQAMQEYSAIAKENMPPELKEAWDQKMAIGVNASMQKIKDNADTQQNQELAATHIAVQDSTRLKTLDAAAMGNLPGMIDGLNTTKQIYANMVKGNLVKPSDAEKAYKTMEDAVTEQYIMSNFDRIMETDLTAATAFYEQFSKSTSEQIYSKRDEKNPNAIQYDSLQRDTMAAQMQKSINSYSAKVDANQKKMVTENNKMADDMLEVMRKGYKPVNIGLIDQMKPGVNVDAQKYEQLKQWQTMLPQVMIYQQYFPQQQEQYLDSLRKQPQTTETIKQIGILEDLHKEDLTLITKDSGAYAIKNLAPKDRPDFFAVLNGKSTMAKFLKDTAPYTKKMFDYTTGKMNFLTNDQANMAAERWNNFSTEEKILEVDEVSRTLGKDADHYFNQLGVKAPLMDQVYMQTQSGRPDTAKGILEGMNMMRLDKSLIDAKKTDDIYNNVIGDRGIMADAESRAELKKAVMAYAVYNNQGGGKENIDEEAIGNAIDSVFGKQEDVGGFWGATNKVTTYGQTPAQWTRYVTDLHPTRVAGKFTGVPAEVLLKDIRAGKTQLIATGIDGEYLVKRNNIIVKSEVPTSNKRKDGSIMMKTFPFKLKLWDPKK